MTFNSTYRITLVCLACMLLGIMGCAGRGKLKLKAQELDAVQADSAPWFQYRGGERASESSEMQFPLSVKWRKKMTALGGTAPGAAGSLIFAGTLNGFLDVLKTSDGDRIARLRNRRTGVHAAPLIFQDQLIWAFGRGEETLVCWNLRTGRRYWEKSLGAIDVSPLLWKEQVLTAGLNGKLTSVRIENGDTEWETDMNAAVYSTPVIVRDKIFVAAMDGIVHALNADDGEEVWACSTGAALYAPLSTDNQTLYIGSAEHTIIAVDCNTGDVKWTQPVGGRVYGGIAVAGNTLVFGCNDRTIYGVDRQTGEVNWTVTTGGVVNTTPLVVGESILVGSLDHSLYAIDTQSGDIQWQFETEGQVRSSPILYRGHIYVASEVKWMYCFEPASSSGAE
jgi:eukaryotic-like serine/threonine-protein kinase